MPLPGDDGHHDHADDGRHDHADAGGHDDADDCNHYDAGYSFGGSHADSGGLYRPKNVAFCRFVQENTIHINGNVELET